MICSGTNEIYKCCLCAENCENVDSLETHLASVHVMYFAYECDFCKDALFPSDHALREHYLGVHQKKIFSVKYKVSPELDERRVILRNLIAKSTANNICQQQQQFTFETANSYTSQLLHNCTELLQTQLFTTKDFLSKCEANNSASASTCKAFSDLSIYGASNPILVKGNNSSLQQVSFGLNAGQSSADIKPSDASLVTSNKNNVRRRKLARKMENLFENSEETSIKQKGPIVQCPECKRMVGKYRNSMIIHVSTHHCDLPIFECLAEGCGKKWYSISARTKDHIKAKHGGNHALLQDNRRQLLPVLKSAAIRLFPGIY